MLKYASKIVTAYMRANPLPVLEVPALISQIVTALERAAQPAEEPAKLAPAVPVRKSVTDAAVICLECGAHQKTLRRHLQTAHGLTPEEYRVRWGLGSDYPMVAPSYAEKRSQLAKEAGLGRKPAVKAEDQAVKPFRYPTNRWSKRAE